MDQVLATHTVIVHEHRHEIHRYQIHTQVSARNDKGVRLVCKNSLTPDCIILLDFVTWLDTLRPAIVVPYSLYNSKHILGTSLSSICM